MDIQSILEEKGISQGEIARETGIKPYKVSRFVRGLDQPNQGEQRQIEEALLKIADKSQGVVEPRTGQSPPSFDSPTLRAINARPTEVVPMPLFHLVKERDRLPSDEQQHIENMIREYGEAEVIMAYDEAMAQGIVINRGYYGRLYQMLEIRQTGIVPSTTTRLF